jgi:hypothetical protein
VAAVPVVTALIASMVSVKLGLSVAVIEIIAGIVVGNTMHLGTPPWLAFLASFGSVVLTFLAGAEVDPTALRKSWRGSLLIGALSFAAPFAPATPKYSKIKIGGELGWVVAVRRAAPLWPATTTGVTATVRPPSAAAVSRCRVGGRR